MGNEHKDGTSFWRQGGKNKWLMAVLVILCFLINAEKRWHFPNIYLDTLAQAATFTNWTSGRGWVAFDEDFGQLTSMHRFPPLYPLALGGMKAMGMQRWTVAVRVLDMFCLWLILAASIKLSLCLGLHKKIPLVLLFLTFSLPPLQYLTSTGMMALAAFSWGMYFLIKDKKKYHEHLATSLLGLAIWIRPAYLPFLALIPIHYFLKWRMSKDEKYLVKGILPSLFLVLVGASLLYWQSLGPNLLPTKRGFFPEHLLQTSPFPVKAFLFWAWPQELKLKAELGGLWTGVKTVLWLLSFVLLWGLWRKMGKKGSGTKHVFVKLGATAIGLNVVFLLFLSLTQAPEDWNEQLSWTYVAEDRYFVPAMWLLCLAFVVQSKTSAWIRRIVLTLTIAYGLIFLWIRMEVYGENARGLGFQDSYSYVLEGELLELKKQKIGPIQLQNDPNNYLLEAYELSPFQKDSMKGINQFGLFSVEEGEGLSGNHQVISSSAKWIFVKFP